MDGCLVGAGADRITIPSGGSMVRGLVINPFPDSGIWLSGGSASVVIGNYIGTDVTGTVSAAVVGTQQGVFVDGSSGNTIGGATTAERNVVSGNRLRGVLLYGAAAFGNRGLGNYGRPNAAG